jgi:hypothetical protein
VGVLHVRFHPIRRVSESQLTTGVGEGERTTGTRCPERGIAPEIDIGAEILTESISTLLSS